MEGPGAVLVPLFFCDSAAAWPLIYCVAGGQTVLLHLAGLVPAGLMLSDAELE